MFHKASELYDSIFLTFSTKQSRQHACSKLRIKTHWRYSV